MILLNKSSTDKKSHNSVGVRESLKRTAASKSDKSKNILTDFSSDDRWPENVDKMAQLAAGHDIYSSLFHSRWFTFRREYLPTFSYPRDWSVVSIIRTEIDYDRFAVPNWNLKSIHFILGNGLLIRMGKSINESPIINYYSIRRDIIMLGAFCRLISAPLYYLIKLQSVYFTL